MYTPRPNREDDVPILQQFVRDNPLCALITQTADGMVASHIPMVLHEQDTGFGLLRGHVARANTQWQDFDESTQALAIFAGPQHYISASWYPDKKTHGREVPTWNYVAVHVYGKLRRIEDAAWLLDHLKTLTDSNEVITQTPWHIEDAPPEFIARLSQAIVGLELEVGRVEGKWKVSQNRTDRDAEAVMEGLRSLATPESETMIKLIQERRPR